MKSFFCTLLGLLPAVGFAQGKNFTMAEAVTGLGSTLAVETIRGATFLSGTPLLQYNAKQSGKDVWVRRNLLTGVLDTLPLTRINQSYFGGDTLKALPQLNWLPNGRGYFVRGNKLYFAQVAMPETMRAELKELRENAANIEVASETGWVAYTIDNDIYLNPPSGTPVQVTSDGSYTIVNGQSVHRNEFGIEGGLFFSPKGNHLAYYRMDQSPVKDYPVVNWGQMPAVSKNIKYPMAGDSSHQVTVWVYHPQTKTTTVLQTGAPLDQYLTAVTWSPDEKYVLVGLLNRDQNHLRMVQYDAMTGQPVKTLFEEKSDAYVEPQHPAQFLPGSTNEFLWWSQRDGSMHLYRYDLSGTLLNAVTKGDWLVNEILAMHAPTNEVLISGTKDGAMDKQVYAVNWKTGKMRRLTQGAGTHTAIASEDGQWLYDTYSSNTVPRVVSIINTRTGKSETLLTAKDPLTGYNRPQVQDVTLRAADGTPLYGKVILPTNFDPSRKYPSITYLYNGPHVQLIRNAWPASGNLWYELLAQKGYVVFTMDGRGSSNRGLAFERATFRKLGTVEMDDQLVGNRYLREQTYIDTARMGVHGWSFGGFMTTSLMLRHPGAYQAGVAGGPVLDWKWYEIMYTERYMDAPQDNPAGYEDARLSNKVKNLKGDLMLIHGTDDDVVVWQHSINFLRSCVENGVQVDYFVYPGHPHNVRGKDRIHLMQKITDYFDEKLR
ncbi:MAG: S9 family peptidase [Sphingobacteriales bacterium]|nr:MAG: S9 family peptidase [Sphingobacteriales bacterium]